MTTTTVDAAGIAELFDWFLESLPYGSQLKLDAWVKYVCALRNVGEMSAKASLARSFVWLFEAENKGVRAACELFGTDSNPRVNIYLVFLDKKKQFQKSDISQKVEDENVSD